MVVPCDFKSLARVSCKAEAKFLQVPVVDAYAIVIVLDAWILRNTGMAEAWEISMCPGTGADFSTVSSDGSCAEDVSDGLDVSFFRETYKVYPATETAVRLRQASAIDAAGNAGFDDFIVAGREEGVNRDASTVGSTSLISLTVCQ